MEHDIIVIEMEKNMFVINRLSLLFLISCLVLHRSHLQKGINYFCTCVSVNQTQLAAFESEGFEMQRHGLCDWCASCAQPPLENT